MAEIPTLPLNNLNGTPSDDLAVYVHCITHIYQT